MELQVNFAKRNETTKIQNLPVVAGIGLHEEE